MTKDKNLQKNNFLCADLIEYLHHERDIATPLNRTNLSDPEYFRALCNIRPPLPASEEFLALQDQYLQEETKNRGVIKIDEIEYQDNISLWQGDITSLKCDAIVNAGNSALLGCFQPLHGCIDNIIHSNAGVQVRLDCQEKMNGRQLPNGGVVVTDAYNLPSKYIFHTVGPIVNSGQPTKQDNSDLRKCYLSCLNKAQKMGLKDIAFCCISTGLYGYPQDQAAALAVEVVWDWLVENSGLKVIFNVFLDEDKRLYEQQLSK